MKNAIMVAAPIIAYGIIDDWLNYKSAKKEDASLTFDWSVAIVKYTRAALVAVLGGGIAGSVPGSDLISTVLGGVN